MFFRPTQTTSSAVENWQQSHWWRGHGIIRALDFIISYKVHVTLLIFLMVMNRWWDWSDPQGWLAAAIFSSVVTFVYLINKVTDVKEDQINTASLPMPPQYARRVTWVALFLVLWPLPFIYNRPGVLALYLFIAIGQGVFYNFKLPLLGFRTKQIWGVKTFMAAVIIAVTPSFVHSLWVYDKIWPWDWWIFAYAQLTFMVASVIWDVRDIEGDRAVGVRTLPNTLPLWATRLVCWGMLIAAGWVRFEAVPVAQFPVLIGLSTNALVVLFMHPRRHRYFFHAYILVWFGLLLYPPVSRLF